jgi:hypothetical protein
MDIKLIKAIYLYLFLILVGSIALVYIIDPLQYLRKAVYTPIYCDEERLQMPALARTLDYDSIILGTSHMHNIEPLKVKELFGFMTLNLTMSSATLYEQDLLLQIALQRNIVKNVIWGIDSMSMEFDYDKIQLMHGPFYLFLYQRPSLLGIFKYTTNFITIRMTIEIFLKYLTGFEKKIYLNYTNDLNTYHSGRGFWNFDPSHTQDLKDKNKLYSTSKKIQFNLSYIEPYLKTKESVNVRKNLERISKTIRVHPTINFFIFCPPYSIAYFREQHKEGKLENYLYGQYITMKELLKYKNVHLFGFLSREDIILNLDNYKDKTHFLKKISYELLNDIKENKNRIDNENDIIENLKKICTFVNKSNGFDK